MKTQTVEGFEQFGMMCGKKNDLKFKVLGDICEIANHFDDFNVDDQEMKPVIMDHMGVNRLEQTAYLLIHRKILVSIRGIFHSRVWLVENPVDEELLDSYPAFVNVKRNIITLAAATGLTITNMVDENDEPFFSSEIFEVTNIDGPWWQYLDDLAGDIKSRSTDEKKKRFFMKLKRLAPRFERVVSLIP